MLQRRRENQRNNRVPKNVGHRRKHRPSSVDPAGHRGAFPRRLAAGVAILLVLLIAVYGILKFLGCLRPCYNCKKCTFGMGRLAALYFGKRSLKDYKHNYRLPVALFYYTLVGPLPAAILLASTIEVFTAAKTAVLFISFAVSVTSALTWRANPSNVP